MPDHKVDLAPERTSRPPEGRSDWVDAVKGLTIVLVVLHHAVAGFRFDPSLPVWVAELTSALTPVRMPLFFLVAGLFAKKALTAPLGSFVQGKVVYFLYFYLLWSLIIFSFRFSLNPITNSTTYWWELLIILWDPLPTIWFLYALMICFVLLRLLQGISPVYVVAIAAVIQAQFLFGAWPGGIVILDRLANFFVFFAIGVYGSEWIRTTASKSRLPIVALCAAGFVTLTFIADGFGLEKAPLVYFSLSVLSAAAIIGTLVFLTKHGRARWLIVIGSYSLYIYLTHFLPVAGTRIVLTKVVGLTDPVLVILIGVAAAIVFGIAFCRLLAGTRLEWLIRVPERVTEKVNGLRILKSPSA